MKRTIAIVVMLLMLVAVNSYQVGYDQMENCYGVLEAENEKLHTQITDLYAEGFIPWYSTKELEAWLDSKAIEDRAYQTDVYDCDNYARDLAVEALKDKRLVGIYRQKGEGCYHLLNFTIIGNELYLIEPQTNEVTYANKVD